MNPSTSRQLHPHTPWKFNSSPLKNYHPNGKVVFQPWFFHGYVKLRGCQLAAVHFSHSKITPEVMSTCTPENLTFWRASHFPNKFYLLTSAKKTLELTVDSEACDLKIGNVMIYPLSSTQNFIHGTPNRFPQKIAEIAPRNPHGFGPPQPLDRQRSRCLWQHCKPWWVEVCHNDWVDQIPLFPYGCFLKWCYPKWMVYHGKPYQNGWFGGTMIFGNTHRIGDHSRTNPRDVSHRSSLTVRISRRKSQGINSSTQFRRGLYTHKDFRHFKVGWPSPIYYK